MLISHHQMAYVNELFLTSIINSATVILIKVVPVLPEGPGVIVPQRVIFSTVWSDHMGSSPRWTQIRAALLQKSPLPEKTSVKRSTSLLRYIMSNLCIHSSWTHTYIFFMRQRKDILIVLFSKVQRKEADGINCIMYKTLYDSRRMFTSSAPLRD